MLTIVLPSRKRQTHKFSLSGKQTRLPDQVVAIGGEVGIIGGDDKIGVGVTGVSMWAGTNTVDEVSR